MPFKDPERKLAYMREWRKEKMDEGYGVWLYKRRKLRFDDAERFRKALQEISDYSYTSVDPAVLTAIADKALEESRAAEEALGHHSDSTNE